MKFNTTIFNTGEWTIAEVATDLGMKMTKRGNYRGWLTKEELEVLDRKGIFYTIWD